MNDLIIYINTQLFAKLNMLVFELYEGKVKILKSRQYSGQLLRTKFSQTHYSNFINDDETKLKELLFSDDSNWISDFQFILNTAALTKLASIIEGKNNLYILLKDKHLHLITDIYINGNEDAFLSQSCTKNWTLENLSIKYSINSIFIYEPPKNDAISKCGNTQNTPAPVPQLFMDIKTKIIQGNLFFQYGDFDMPSNYNKPYIEIDRKIARNYNLERFYIKNMLKEGFAKSLKNAYRFDRRKSLQYALDRLIEQGFDIFVSKKKIRSSHAFAFSVQYKNNWFELNTTIDNTAVNLSHFIDTSVSTGFIEYNNEIILLPDTLKNTITYLEEKDGNAGFSVTNIPKVFDVIEYNTVATSSIADWEDYNAISLKFENRFTGILSPYQEIGAKWLKFLYTKSLGGCLADEMGLGKTVQIIALLCDSEVFANIKSKKALIIVPKTLLQNWSMEFNKFAPSISVGLYYGNARSFETINACSVCITTFQTLTRDIDKFTGIKYDCVIIDEIQNINNNKTLTSRTIKSLNARIKYGLSGTPVENNINELVTIMDIVVPGLLDNINKNSFDENGNILKSVSESIRRRTMPFILKRSKKDVLLGLPQKHIETINCTMGKRQKDLYDSILLSLKNYLARPNGRYSIKDYSNILKSLLYLRESCCDPRLIPHEINLINCVESAKLDVLKTICRRIITKNEKLIIFSQFSKMLKIINTELNGFGVPIFVLDGSTLNRQEIVDKFESSKEGIFLISLKAGGVGLNLVSCHVGVIYDPWWNLAAEEQAIDRMHRIGQKNNVVIYKLIMKDTVEDKVRFLQDKKSKLIHTLLDGFDFSGDKVNIDLINEIIN